MNLRTLTLFAWTGLVAGATLAGEDYRARIGVDPVDDSGTERALVFVDRYTGFDIDCPVIERNDLPTSGGLDAQRPIEITVDDVDRDVVVASDARKTGLAARTIRRLFQLDGSMPRPASESARRLGHAG